MTKAAREHPSKAPVGGQKRELGLKDLAKIAQVDVSTVSRALNHDPRINADRAQDIRRLAKKLGYRPRPLRSKQAKAIGLVISSYRPDRPDMQFLGRLSWGVHQVLAERRMHIHLECVPREPAPSPSLPAIVQENRVDGILAAGHPPTKLIDQIRDMGMPVVAINDSPERLGVSCVSSRSQNAIHDAILRLAALGHTHFGHISSGLYPTVQSRFDAYKRTLTELHLEIRESWQIADLSPEIAGGREGIRALAKLEAMPTVIVCENDWFATGAIMELQRMGIRVPEDISIIGHDDIALCKTVDPQLSSICRPENDMISQAVDLLLEQISGKPDQQQDITIEGEMVWRNSTGPSPKRVLADA